MPTNENADGSEGSNSSSLDEIRERMTTLIADLDELAQDIAAAHVQTALDALGFL